MQTDRDPTQESEISDLLPVLRDIVRIAVKSYGYASQWGAQIAWEDREPGLTLQQWAAGDLRSWLNVDLLMSALQTQRTAAFTPEYCSRFIPDFKATPTLQLQSEKYRNALSQAIREALNATAAERSTGEGRTLALEKLLSLLTGIPEAERTANRITENLTDEEIPELIKRAEGQTQPDYFEIANLIRSNRPVPQQLSTETTVRHVIEFAPVATHPTAPQLPGNHVREELPSKQPLPSHKGLSFDYDRRQVCVDGVWVDLTEEQMIMWNMLWEAAGGWTPGKDISPTANKTKYSMPPRVKDEIAFNRHDGYRLKRFTHK